MRAPERNHHFVRRLVVPGEQARYRFFPACRALAAESPQYRYESISELAPTLERLRRSTAPEAPSSRARALLFLLLTVVVTVRVKEG